MCYRIALLSIALSTSLLIDATENNPHKKKAARKLEKENQEFILSKKQKSLPAPDPSCFENNISLNEQNRPSVIPFKKRFVVASTNDSYQTPRSTQTKDPKTPFKERIKSDNDNKNKKRIKNNNEQIKPNQIQETGNTVQHQITINPNYFPLNSIIIIHISNTETNKHVIEIQK